MERQLGKNEKGYKALEGVAKIMESLSVKGYSYEVKDCYLDFGQGWMWSTIIAKKSDGDSYQAICPRDWKLIVDNGCPSAICQAINNIVNDSRKYGLDKFVGVE